MVTQHFACLRVAHQFWIRWYSEGTLSAKEGGSMSTQEPTERRYSRAKALRYMGTGAAVAWTAPMIMTGTAEATVANQKVCAKAAIRNAGQGGSDSPCGVCAGQVDCGSGCFCLITSTGCCFCHQPSSCALTTCRNKRDCPAGWECAYSCCGGLLCIPPCGTQASGAARLQAGARSTHRAA